MKKATFFLVLIFISVCNNLSAQRQITLGIKGGFSIPNLTGGSSDNPLNTGYSSRLGADYGVYGEYHLCSRYSVSLGVEYASQGGKKDKMQAFSVPDEMLPMLPPNTNYLYADYKSEAKIDYLILPILARSNWSLSKSIPVKIYAAVGPFVGFLLRARQVTSGSSIIYLDQGRVTPVTDQPQSFDNTTDIKDQLRTLNFGVDGFVGISYSFLSRNTLFVEGGGNYGFISIQKGTINGKNYTGAGVVTLGYAYTF